MIYSMITPKDSEKEDKKDTTLQAAALNSLATMSATETSTMSTVTDGSLGADEDKDIVVTSFVDVGKCSLHDQRTILGFCETCCTTVCAQFMSDPSKNHLSHEVLSNDEWMTKYNCVVKARQELVDLLKQTSDKQQQLLKTKEEVKEGHERQIKEVQAKEKKLLEHLEEQYQEDAKKLKDTLEKKKEMVKKMAAPKVETIEVHCKQQLQRVEEKMKRTDAVTIQAKKVVNDMKEDPAKLEMSAQMQLRGRAQNVVRDQDTKADCDNISKEVRNLQLLDLEPPAGADTSMFSVSLDPDSISDIRKKIKAVIPCDVTHNNNTYTEGQVVITRKYHIWCRSFGDGTSDVFPGPLQGPKLDEPYSSLTDATLLPPNNAAALCSIVGGNPSVTRDHNNRSWLYDNILAFRSSWLFQENGAKLCVKRKHLSCNHCCLPVHMSFYEGLEKFLGWGPSVVKDQSTGFAIDRDATVATWGDPLCEIYLIVLK